jgi:hypothetical protein
MLHETEVDVDVPLHQKVGEWMTRVASTLNVGEGLVRAVTALVATVLAVWALVSEVRRHRRKKSHPPSGTTGVGGASER